MKSESLLLHLPTIDEIFEYAHKGKFPPIAGGAVAGHWYNKGLANINNNTIDWVNTTTIRCALATTSYTPNRDTDEHYNPAFNSTEVVGTGYTIKGVELTGRSVSTDDGTDQARCISTTNPSWGPGATFDFRYAIIYEDSGTDTTSHLFGYIDCNTGGGNLSVVNGTLTITWDATGVLRFDAQ